MTDSYNENSKTMTNNSNKKFKLKKIYNVSIKCSLKIKIFIGEEPLSRG